MLKRPKTFKHVYQFKISLDDAPVDIWRRIQIPDNYTFWDFHVAIQSAMGWFDSHLHNFYLKNPITGEKSFIEMEGFFEEFDEEDEFLFMGSRRVRSRPKHYREIEQFVANWFTPRNKKGKYTYDFGDNWDHTIVLEKILPKERGKTYPVCLAGKGLCPPEDCGGTWGYAELLEAVSDPQHERHEEFCEWLEGLGLDPQMYLKPEVFHPEEVEFEDPDERWQEYQEYKDW